MTELEALKVLMDFGIKELVELSKLFEKGGIDAQGNFILRADLASAAKQAGWTVWDQMKPGITVLVASRSDTVKAKKAVQMGTQIYSYPEFLACLAKDDLVPAPAYASKAKANPYTDPGVLAQMQQLTAAQKHEEAVAPFLGRGKLL